MENRNFVITSLQSWDIEIGSTIKNTAVELSKSNRVLYINTPMDHSTWLRGVKNKAYNQRLDVIKKRKPYLRKINDNFWVADCPFMVYSISKIKNKSLFTHLNKLNNKKIAHFITKVAKEIGFNDFIHLMDTDIYRSQYLKKYIKPAVSIYYRRDYVIGESYWKNHGERLEHRLCAKADIVLANSLYFADQLRIYNPKTYDIETGVNLELYDHKCKYDIPPDIATIPKPIIGYIGTINGNRLDGDMLLYLAEKRPDYSFVFTGPEDDFFKKHALHNCSNVYFLGNKEVKQLPSYIAAYDVCINPQIVNSMTIGNYPLKIDEYLAMGKPTVATKTHTMTHIFNDYVFLADNKDGYLIAIEEAVAEVGDEAKRVARIGFAHTHSWENSVKKICNIIETYEQNNRKNNEL